MSCQHARELMIDALVDRIDADQQRALSEHVDGCVECRAELKAIRELWNSLDTVAIPEPDPEGLQKLLRSVTREFGDSLGPQSVNHGGQKKRRSWLLQTAAAFAMIAVGASLTLTYQFLDRASDSTVEVGDGRTRYLFVMSATTEPPELSDQASEEFQSWITGLVDSGVMETGFGLAETPPVGTLPEGALMDEQVMGFIIVLAENGEAARRIAASSPSLRYGGSIEVRELD